MRAFNVPKKRAKYHGRKYATEFTIRKEFVDKMNSGNYTVSYLAKMAKVTRSTLYKWREEIQSQKIESVSN